MKLKKIRPARLIRWAVLAASTVFFLFISGVVSEHAICPIGGFEMFFTGIFNTGFTIAGLFSGMVILFLIMSVFSIIFRRAYCGYVCPMGALQELFEKIGRLVLPKKLRKKLRVPQKADKILRWFKYPVLSAFVVFAGLIGGHWMIKADPFIAMMGLFKGQGISVAFLRNPGSYIFFFAILIFAFFMGRGFCKYICPAGAWYAILSKLSPNRIVRNQDKCSGCTLCSRACPMDIDVANLEKVTAAECIGCQECVNACPVDGALSSKMGKADIPKVLVPIAAAAVFSGGLVLASSVSGQGGGRPHGSGGGDYRGEPREVSEADVSASTAGTGYAGCSSCVGCGICAG